MQKSGIQYESRKLDNQGMESDNEENVELSLSKSDLSASDCQNLQTGPMSTHAKKLSSNNTSTSSVIQTPLSLSSHMPTTSNTPFLFHSNDL